MHHNPLQTRDDFAKAAAEMLQPLLPYMSNGRARLHLGHSGAGYPDTIAQMEAFSRPLWALVPMLAGSCPQAEPLWAQWREGLENGTNPKHPEYWGAIGPRDQRMVEMAVMGVGLCLVPQRFLKDLSEESQQNLIQWLSQINQHDMPPNNWVFFRVLVNLGLLVNGFPYDESRMDADLALVEEHYEGDGWYFDYDTQRDYYTPWGFHYYGLFYAHVMRTRDPERSARFLARARLYAPQFAAWFASDGAAIPYGRSQTYRFAQGSFFAALALGETDTPAMPWGQIKHLLLNNLRWWMKQPVFTGDGLLSIGYAYPNLCMAENYNAPGSPYWGLKAFLPLALPASHPFWTSVEQPFMPPAISLQESARMLIVRDPDNRHAQGFTAGNHSPGTARSDAKYEKFAYSTAFAFSVSQETRTLEQGAFDSLLALTDDGMAWRVRFGCESFRFEQDRLFFTWKPYKDVTVHTEIIPMGDWHKRIHRIQTPRPLQAAEGGYAICREQGNISAQSTIDGLRAIAHAPWGASGIVGFEGYTRADVIAPVPNTNLLHPRTLLPTLLADIPAGETQLSCAVLGAVQFDETFWNNPPKA